MKGKKLADTSSLKKRSPQGIRTNEATIGDLWKGRSKHLFEQVDISSIVFFRILFGLIMFYESSRYLQKDWIAKYWLEPAFHLTYWPFDFLSPLPGNGMYGLFYLMAILSLCIAAGLFYRVCMPLFFICFSYIFLLEQSRYLNHFYLVILISFLMIFIPANTSGSIDSKLFKSIKSETAPAWSLWLLRFMIGVPYFFGGIAKINTDWLHGHPLNQWLLQDVDIPIIGSFFKYHWMILFMAYSGMLLDLLIVPAMLFRKTRKWGFPFIALFHLMNSQLFDIGIFPWFMIAATSLYFDPSWFRNIINYVTSDFWPLVLKNKVIAARLTHRQKLILAALFLWVFLQVTIPLRHFLVPGNVHWTEEGHRYSWHMKLRTKHGEGIYTVKDKKTGKIWEINPDEYLTKKQLKDVNTKPYLVWKFCQIIKKNFAEKGINVAVYADVKASLNGRHYQQLIDPTVDLSDVPRPIFPANWILPLTTGLNDTLDTVTVNNESKEND